MNVTIRFEGLRASGQPHPERPNAYRSPRPNKGRYIYIQKATRSLTLFSGGQAIRRYPVGIGKPHTPTPVGDYAIANKIMQPGGALGSRWMGLNFDTTYGIHGTAAPWSIGNMVSKGCIRMHNHNVEELFGMVVIGTPVVIRD